MNVRRSSYVPLQTWCETRRLQGSRRTGEESIRGRGRSTSSNWQPSGFYLNFLYIHCQFLCTQPRFMVVVNYESFKSLNALLIFPLLSHETSTQSNFWRVWVCNVKSKQMHRWGDILQIQLVCLDTVHFTTCLYSFASDHLFTDFASRTWKRVSYPAWTEWIAKKCDASGLFSILEMPYSCQIIHMMILYIWSHRLICAEISLKVIVPVTNASEFLRSPSQVPQTCSK